MQGMKIIFAIKKYIQLKIEMSLLRNKIINCYSTHSYSIYTHSKKKKCISEIFCEYLINVLPYLLNSQLQV